MYIFILSAIVLALAAVLWYSQAYGPAEKAPPPPEPDPDQRLRYALAEDSHMTEALTHAVRDLEAVMAHPELGGPGFLMVQFPAAEAGGHALVTAQYPNIQEALYRRIVRQELDDLAAVGVPEALLSQEPAFETESGGVVLIAVQAGSIPPQLAESLHDRKERNTALGILAEMLEERLPEFSIRIFGTDLLLTPVREKPEKAAVSAISRDE